MQFLRKLNGWISTWFNPVTPEFIEELMKASKSAAASLNQSKTYPYFLLTTSRNIEITQKNLKPFSFLKMIYRSLSGSPISIGLYQKDAWGFIGPFGKLRKRRRVKGDVKENAIVFWPCPDGRIDEKKTNHVLKLAVGGGNLAKEIRMLRMVNARTGLAPAVTNFDPKLRWLVLDFVSGGGKQKPSKQAQIYLEHIASKFFESWGCKTRSLAYHLNKHGIKKTTFIECAKQLGIENATVLLEGDITFSITHGGGICEECLLTENGDAYLLDWEKAVYGPISEDLIQVFHHWPEKTMEVMEQLRTPESMDANDQLKVALILRRIFNSSKSNPNAAKLQLDMATAGILKKMSC